MVCNIKKLKKLNKRIYLLNINENLFESKVIWPFFILKGFVKEIQICDFKSSPRNLIKENKCIGCVVDQTTRRFINVDTRLCYLCAEQQKNKIKKCPVCHAEIDDILKIKA